MSFIIAVAKFVQYWIAHNRCNAKKKVDWLLLAFQEEHYFVYAVCFEARWALPGCEGASLGEPARCSQHCTGTPVSFCTQQTAAAPATPPRRLSSSAPSRRSGCRIRPRMQCQISCDLAIASDTVRVAVRFSGCSAEIDRCCCRMCGKEPGNLDTNQDNI